MSWIAHIKAHATSRALFNQCVRLGYLFAPITLIYKHSAPIICCPLRLYMQITMWIPAWIGKGSHTLEHMSSNGR